MRRRRNPILHDGGDTDPLASVANLFDVAMVFAVALLVAMTARFNLGELLSQEDFTMVKNPGSPKMEIISREGGVIRRYTPSENQESDGPKGRRVGVAYELESGEIVYIPE